MAILFKQNPNNPDTKQLVHQVAQAIYNQDIQVTDDDSGDVKADGSVPFTGIEDFQAGLKTNSVSESTIGAGILFNNFTRYTNATLSSAGSTQGTATLLSKTFNKVIHSGVQEDTSFTAVADGAIREQRTITTVADTGRRAIAHVNTVGEGSAREVSTAQCIAEGSLKEETSITCVGDVANSLDGTYFLLHSPTVNYAVWIHSNVAVAPVIPGYTTVQVNITTNDTAATIKGLMITAIGAIGASAVFTTASFSTDTFTVENKVYGTCIATVDVDTGFLISQLVAGHNSDLSGKYFQIHSPTVDYYAWFNVIGLGSVDPAPGGTGIAVTLNPQDTATSVNVALQAALTAEGGAGVVFTCTGGTDTAIITNTAYGAATDIAVGTSGFTVGAQTQGHNSVLNSTYFIIYSPTTQFYVWFNVAGGGVDPAPGGTGIAVALSLADSANSVATKTATALNAYGAGIVFIAPAPGANSITVTCYKAGSVSDPDAGTSGFTVGLNNTPSPSNLEGTYFTVFGHIGGGVQVSYYVWYKVNATSVDPAPGGTAIPITFTYGDTANTIAALTATALNAVVGAGVVFIAPAPVANVITCTNTLAGTATDANAHTSGFTINTTIQGVNSVLSGTYFTLNSHTVAYYCWFNVTGCKSDSSDPAPVGKTGIEVTIAGGASAATVATATSAAINGQGGAGVVFATTSIGATSFTALDVVYGTVVDAADVNSNFVIVVGTQGVSDGTGVVLDATHGVTIVDGTAALYDFYIYPDSGKVIDGGSPDSPITLTAGRKTMLNYYDGIGWVSYLFAAS